MKTNRKKLSTTITLFLVIVLSLLNIVSILFLTTTAGSALNRKQDAFMHETNTSAKRQVEQFIEKYVTITKMLSKNELLRNTVLAGTEAEPMQNSAGFSYVIGNIQTIMRDYPDILNIAFASIAEDRVYTQDGTRTDIRISSRPYFAQASQDLFLTQPYIDTATGDLCASIAAPIRNDSATVGIILVDLNLGYISEFMDRMSFGKTGHSVLLSADNILISHYDRSMIGKNMNELGLQGDILDEVLHPTAKIMRYQLHGESKVAIAQSLEFSGWKVLSLMTRQEYDSQTVKTMSILALFLIVNSIIACLLIRSIIVKKLKPIAQLNDGLRHMSEGDLSVTITHTSNDEIGEMADSMRSCVESLSSYVGEIDTVMDHLSDGDLTVQYQLEFKGDFISIQKATMRFMDKLTDLINNISRASAQVSTGSEQVSATSQSLAQGATEQASSVEELVATISELSATVNNNAEMAQRESANVLHVNDQISLSGEKMSQTLTMIEEIRMSANKVNGIVKTIEDIAFQTNILALNAAVEAARAGQAGKGFAVVASEVRNLAAKSAEASQATTDVIGGMVSAIEKGSKSMEETKHYMDDVISQAIGITEVFQKISEASEEQAVSISQVTLGTDQISSVVQTNSATAEESAAASEELSSQAQMLKSMIQQFKLPSDGSDFAAHIPADYGASDLSSYDDSDFIPSNIDKY